MSDEKKMVFGIDLGTTYSCIAYVDEFGKPVVIKNSEGHNITPSVVLFEDDQVTVGEEAKKQAVIFPDSVVSEVKRRMVDPDLEYRFFHGDNEYRPEDISALILKKVAGDATQMMGIPVTDVVITCPAYFGTDEREATKAAGKIAGLNVLEIINEPTAAAFAYGLQGDGEDQVVMVYDLGGGTFDITIIAIRQGSVQVIATGGNHKLGGKDWDTALVRHFHPVYQEKSGLDLYEDDDAAEDYQDAYLQAESCKKALSAKPKARMVVGRVRQEITLDVFDTLTEPLLNETIMHTQKTLAEAKSKGYELIDKILLVGGSTRMLQIKQRLQQEFPTLEPEIYDPDEAVAKGAALYGQKLLLGQKIKEEVSKGKSEVEAAQQVAENHNLRLPAVEKLLETRVENVTSRGYGVIVVDNATGKDILAVLIAKNTTTPIEHSEQFGTINDNQSTVRLRVMETPLPDDKVIQQEQLEKACKDMGEASLSMPPGLPRGAPIKVTFQLDGEGILHMTGTDLTSGKQVEASFETERTMSSEDISLAKQQLDKLQMG